MYAKTRNKIIALANIPILLLRASSTKTENLSFENGNRIMAPK